MWRYLRRSAWIGRGNKRGTGRGLKPSSVKIKKVLTKFQSGLIIKVQKIKKTTKTKEKEREEMMKEETAREINELKAEVGSKMFSKEEASKFVSIQTLKNTI